MRNAPKTRASLILRLRDRDDLNAWQEFSEIYQPLVFRLARSKGFQHTDALDVAQEVLVRVAGAIDRWDPDTSRGSFRGWLHKISRNLMIDFLQRGRRQPITAGSSGMVELIEQQPDASSLQSQVFDTEFRRQVFAWAADRIRPAFHRSTWNAFWQTAVASQPATQVANELGLTVGAVYIARSRVMQKLREEVQRFLSSDDIEGVLP